MQSMNLASVMRSVVDRYPEREALVYRDRRHSYSEWNLRINRVAHAISDYGVCPTDRVGMYLGNSEASVTGYFACQKLGAVPVPLNYRLAWREAARVLRDSGARLLIYDARLAGSVRKIDEELSALHGFIRVAENEADSLPAGHLDFEVLASNFPKQNEPYYTPDGGDLSALVYTSGSTGHPKGVMHTHQNDVAIAMNCVMEYGLRHTDRALHIAPLYHVGGMQAFFTPHLLVGGTNVLLQRFDPLVTLKALQNEHVTTLFAVPTQITQLLQHQRFPTFDVKSLRLVTTGGSHLAAATMQRITSELCPYLFNGYGMTEASLTLILHPEDVIDQLGTCGKPTLITEARIVRRAEGEVLPTETVGENEVGELIVRGPQVMKGYWNRPLETAEKLKYGWFYTGDLFSRNRDGFYTYHGRSDDLIVSGGENIYPREVEEVLYRLEGVRECHVLGILDPDWGQAVTAFVVKDKPGLCADDVSEFCKNSPDLAAFKRPKKVIFLDALPRNPSGKVVKSELLELFESLERSPRTGS